MGLIVRQVDIGRADSRHPPDKIRHLISRWPFRAFALYHLTAGLCNATRQGLRL